MQQNQSNLWNYRFLIAGAVFFVLILAWIFLVRKPQSLSDANAESASAENAPTASANMPPPQKGQLQRPAIHPKTATLEGKTQLAAQKQQLARQAHTDFVHQDYPAALEKLVEYYTWTFEHDYNPSVGVRMTFGLNFWKELIEAYPSAQEKLREMADTLEEQLCSKNFSDIPFDYSAKMLQSSEEAKDWLVANAMMGDFCGFNKVLGTPERAVEVLRAMHQNNAELAGHCWRNAEDVLFLTESYDLIQQFIPDLNAEFDSLIQRFTSMEKLEAQFQPQPSDPLDEEAAAKQDARRNAFLEFVETRLGRLLDFGFATGQDETVCKLVELAVKEFPEDAPFYEKYMSKSLE